ncbi:MAG: CBS domain-containing protein [Candidatus Binatia bacterium]
MRVKDIMHREVETLGLEDALDVADDIMTLGRVRHLPVVAGESHLVGLVTQRDLLKASLASVLELGRRAEHDWLKSIPVRLVMNTELETIAPNDPLKCAVDRMIAKKIGCLPVVEEGKLVGLLTETDCLQVLAAALADEPPPARTH